VAPNPLAPGVRRRAHLGVARRGAVPSAGPVAGPGRSSISAVAVSGSAAVPAGITMAWFGPAAGALTAAASAAGRALLARRDFLVHRQRHAFPGQSRDGHGFLNPVYR